MVMALHRVQSIQRSTETGLQHQSFVLHLQRAALLDVVALGANLAWLMCLLRYHDLRNIIHPIRVRRCGVVELRIFALFSSRIENENENIEKNFVTPAG